MRVHKSYYLDGKFDRPDKVTHIVRWANQLMKEIKDQQDPRFLVAKRIKSLCLKNYRLSKNSDARFYSKWEEFPRLMMEYILDRFPDGRCMLVRKNKKGNFEPSNLEIRAIV